MYFQWQRHYRNVTLSTAAAAERRASICQLSRHPIFAPFFSEHYLIWNFPSWFPLRAPEEGRTIAAVLFVKRKKEKESNVDNIKCGKREVNYANFSNKNSWFSIIVVSPFATPLVFLLDGWGLVESIMSQWLFPPCSLLTIFTSFISHLKSQRREKRGKRLKIKIDILSESSRHLTEERSIGEWKKNKVEKKFHAFNIDDASPHSALTLEWLQST